jgi:hypothetical protein
MPGAPGVPWSGGGGVPWAGGRPTSMGGQGMDPMRQAAVNALRRPGGGQGMAGTPAGPSGMTGALSNADRYAPGLMSPAGQPGGFGPAPMGGGMPTQMGSAMAPQYGQMASAMQGAMGSIPGSGQNMQQLLAQAGRGVPPMPPQSGYGPAPQVNTAQMPGMGAGGGMSLNMGQLPRY